MGTCSKSVCSDSNVVYFAANGLAASGFFAASAQFRCKWSLKMLAASAFAASALFSLQVSYFAAIS